MADFCYDCFERLFGDGTNNDMRELCADDEYIMVLCEGCGVIWVDHIGGRLSNGTN
jgi:hypothetical protein